jgi:hypothetical protein
MRRADVSTPGACHCATSSPQQLRALPWWWTHMYRKKPTFFDFRKTEKKFQNSDIFDFLVGHLVFPLIGVVVRHTQGLDFYRLKKKSSVFFFRARAHPQK